MIEEKERGSERPTPPYLEGKYNGGDNRSKILEFFGLPESTDYDQCVCLVDALDLAIFGELEGFKILNLSKLSKALQDKKTREILCQNLRLPDNAVESEIGAALGEQLRARLVDEHLLSSNLSLDEVLLILRKRLCLLGELGTTLDIASLDKIKKIQTPELLLRVSLRIQEYNKLFYHSLGWLDVWRYFDENPEVYVLACEQDWFDEDEEE